MSKTYRTEAVRSNSRSRPQHLPEFNEDLDMLDYLDEMELDREAASSEFFGVQPRLSVDHSIN